MSGPPGHMPGYHIPRTQVPIGAVVAQQQAAAAEATGIDPVLPEAGHDPPLLFEGQPARHEDSTWREFAAGTIEGDKGADLGL